MAKENHLEGKLVSKGFNLGRVGITLNRQSFDNLVYLTEKLGAIIGREVSRTLAVRLALSELRREVERLEAEGETTALARMGIRVAREVR